MMDAFTQSPSTDSVPRATTPTMVKGATSLPPSAPDENKEPSATPPSSPRKHFSPSTPKSTPLHRRYLQEVAMSPATPSRTPTQDKRDNVTKGRDSPTKGRESPSKQNVEIGQNGFYFSCELPMGKVTPKKGGTPSRPGSPKKDGPTGTPTKRTPKPVKESSPVKKSPAKALFGTPPRKTGTPMQSRAATPVKRTAQSNGSPLKSVKTASRFAQNLSSTPTEKEASNATCKAPAASNSGGRAPPAEKIRTSTTSHLLDIGHLMAGLNVSALKAGGRAGKDHVDDQDRIQRSEPPTPLRRAAERLPSLDYSTMQRPDDHTTNVSTGTQTAHLSPEIIVEPNIALDMKKQEQTLQYPPLLFPKAKPEAGEGGPEQATAQPSSKHVNWQGAHSLSPKAPKGRIPRILKRVGTDPGVRQAMHTEMVMTEASLRRSTGNEYFLRVPVNNNELPAMSNTLFEAGQEAREPALTSTRLASRTLSRANSDTSSLGTVRASMVMGAQKRAGAPKIPSTPQPLTHITATHSASKERAPATKHVNTAGRFAGKSSAPGTSRTSPTSAASIKSTKVTTGTVRTPQQRSGTPKGVETPSRIRLRDTTARATPVATPSRSKDGGASRPRGVGKPASNTPTSTRGVSAAKLPTLTRQPLPRTPLPSRTPRLPRLITSKPYNPATDPRPYEKKFASAVEIADRVAGWNSEDRKKAAQSKLSAPRVLTSPTKAAKSPSKQKTDQQSYTPEGSPNKLPSPVKSPTLHPTHLKPAPAPTPGSARPTTKLPKTPGPRKTAVNRLKGEDALKTPASRRIGVLDRNALRTPSKAIESSLDRAIDAKIAEDAKSGKEFTPSGNRVKDLLEARQGQGL